MRTLIALISVVAVVGVLAAIFVPAHLKRQHRSKTVKATMNLRRIYDASVTYYSRESCPRRGDPFVPDQFPRSVTSTPARSACADGSSALFAPDPARWSDPTWQALEFTVDDPSYLQYVFESAGVGTAAAFTARANGDLDCDGQLSTFERVGKIDAEGLVSGGLGIYKHDPLE